MNTFNAQAVSLQSSSSTNFLIKLAIFELNRLVNLSFLFLLLPQIKNFFLSHSISENVEEKYESTQLIVKFESNIWKVNLVDTGHETMTGGRLKRVSNYLQKENFF